MSIIHDSEIAQDALFFERELLNILPKIYEQKRPLPSARALLPLTIGDDPDADVFIATMIKWVGEAAAGEIAWKNGADTPTISASREEKLYRVAAYKLAAQWEGKVLRKARKEGLDLQSRGVQRIFDDLRLKESNLVWNGDTNQPAGVYGVTNHADIGTTALPSTVTWNHASTTSDEQYADLVFMGDFIAQNTSFTQTAPVNIYLPWTAYNIVKSRRMAAGTDTTVLQYFMNNRSQWVNDVIPVRELNSSKRAMVMVPSEDVATNYLVQDVTALRPMEYSDGFSVEYRLRTAGFVVFDSTAIRLFSEILT